MSSLPPSSPAPSPPPMAATPISAWGYFWRVGGALLLLLVLVIGGLLFYASTPHFSNFVRQRVINVLEDATGGRVDLQSLHWSLGHLAVEVEGLTIHGLEGPGELPYAHVDRLYARVKILSFVNARLGLDFLEVDRPSVHLIIYPDGTTNQPTPKAKESSSGPATIRTIFDLQANRVEVHDGMALLNERAIPFQLAANDVGVVVTYAPASGHYLGQLVCSDLTALEGKAAVIHSKLDLSVEAADDAVDLKTLHFTTGKTSIQASGSLLHYANPQWKLSAGGTVELAEVSALGAVDGFSRGSVELAFTGQGSGASQYVLDGTAKLINAGYAIPYVQRIDGLNAITRLHITPDEISLPGVVARPRQGGIVNADIRFLNWRSPDNLPQSAPNRQVMGIHARVHGVRLSAVLQAVADPGYRDYGFDTLGEGPVNIDWTGSVDDLTVAANLVMSAPPSVAPGQVPLSGTVDAKYFQRSGRVQINQLQAHSPATTLNTTGSLGVYPLNEASNLSVHLATRNLSEFDRVLKVLDLGIGEKKGISGVPSRLHGEATFDGTGDGSLWRSRVPRASDRYPVRHCICLPAAGAAGTPQHAPQPAVGPVALPAPAPARRRWNRRLQCPPCPLSTGIIWMPPAATRPASSSWIMRCSRRGATVIHASGQLQAHRINRRRQDFDAESPLTATAQVQKASLTDVLGMAARICRHRHSEPPGSCRGNAGRSERGRLI